jgi:hypothetical protein
VLPPRFTEEFSVDPVFSSDPVLMGDYSTLPASNGVRRDDENAILSTLAANFPLVPKAGTTWKQTIGSLRHYDDDFYAVDLNVLSGGDESILLSNERDYGAVVRSPEWGVVEWVSENFATESGAVRIRHNTKYTAIDGTIKNVVWTSEYMHLPLEEVRKVKLRNDRGVEYTIDEYVFRVRAPIYEKDAENKLVGASFNPTAPAGEVLREYFLREGQELQTNEEFATVGDRGAANSHLHYRAELVQPELPEHEQSINLANVITKAWKLSTEIDAAGHSVRVGDAVWHADAGLWGIRDQKILLHRSSTDSAFDWLAWESGRDVTQLASVAWTDIGSAGNKKFRWIAVTPQIEGKDVWIFNPLKQEWQWAGRDESSSW